MKRELKTNMAQRILGEGHFNSGDMLYDRAYMALCELSYKKLNAIQIVICNRKEIYTKT
jgi:hypothetical protein